MTGEILVGCGPDKLRFHKFVRRCNQFLIGFFRGIHSPQELRELALPIHTGQFKFIVFQMLPLNTGREGTGRLANSKAKQAIVLNDEWKEFRKNAIRNGFNNCDVS